MFSKKHTKIRCSKRMMMVKGLYIPCAILAGVWVFHILYFIFGVKTLEEPPAG